MDTEEQLLTLHTLRAFDLGMFLAWCWGLVPMLGRIRVIKDGKDLQD